MPTYYDPNTGKPIAPAAPPPSAKQYYDPDTGQPLQNQSDSINPSQLPPDTAKDAWQAGIHGKMLGMDPGTAYQHRDEIGKQLKAVGGNYDDGKIDDTLMNDLKVGLQGSIFGLHHREALPQEVKNPGMVDKFVTGLTQMVADSPFMLAGGVAGGAAGSEVPIVGNAVGAGMGAFAAPAAIREGLVEGIKNGGVKSFSDLLHRAAGVTWAGAKGAVTGAVTELAGGLPVGSFIAKSGVGEMAVKGLYQATALTTTADLLEGKLPSKNDFAGNAALIVPLNLITHGMAMTHGETEQATMDVYAKDGKTPQQTATMLAAQPPVKPDLPPGLTPAIKSGEGVIEGDTTDTHATLAERVLAKKPITMAQLEADPAKADSVLESPSAHEQGVIDKAWELKKQQIEAEGIPDEQKKSSVEAAQREQDMLAAQQKESGIQAPMKDPPKDPQTIDDLYDRNQMKSGRGFTTPDGQFLTREQARAWMKENEPDTHDMWTKVAGDKSAELHSEDYAEARNRVQGRNVVSGDPVANALPPDLQNFIAENRSGILNKVKAGDGSKGYGYEAIRTMLVGPRNFLRAEGEQIVGRLRKLVPDKVDQEALHFARDYRDDPNSLKEAIDEVRAGDNEKLKAHLPAMERALQPMSPEMAKADQAMTDYFTKALAEGRAVGTLNAGIDPSRYSPRMFMKATEEGQTASGAGRPNFTDKTVNSIRRDYLHTLDPLKEGETEARTFNALDELSIYNDRHSVAISTALFKTELKNSALGVEGSRKSVPSGWVPLTKQFEDKRTFENEDGSSTTTVKNLYVPKDIADAIRPLLEEPGQLAQLSKFLHVQSIIKGIELTLSAFHIKALNITAFNNMKLTGWLKSTMADSNAPDVEAIERRGALYGLTTTKTSAPIDAYRGLTPDVAPTGLARLTDNAVVNKVDDAAKAITKYTFDVVQRKWKVMDFAKKEAGWIAKHPEATENEYAAAMRGYAKEVNAAYGGLNWDVMGMSKGMLNVSRMFLLAPDWTFSNLANMKYALTDGGTAGAASRAFLVKSFATGFASTAAASIYIGGKYDPTDTRHLDQVYLGKDKHGKDLYANWFFAGLPKDTMNLIKRVHSDGVVGGIAEVALSKASPIAGGLIDIAENKDYKGAPIYKKKDNVAVKTGKDILYGAGRVMPITGVTAFDTIKNALTDPNHEYSYKDILSLAADAAGSPAYAYGKGQGSGRGQGLKLPGQKKRGGSMKLPGQKRFKIR